MTTISLRMDDEMKKELDEMCEAMGMAELESELPICKFKF